MTRASNWCARARIASWACERRGAPKRTKASAEGFHGTLEGWERLLEIAGDHDWFTFNARVERQKPWLGDFGELRSILHVYDQDNVHCKKQLPIIVHIAWRDQAPIVAGGGPLDDLATNQPSGFARPEEPVALGENVGSFWGRILRQCRQRTQRHDDRETASILRLTIETLTPLISGLAGFVSRPTRSEERRVGKECRSRGWPDHSKKRTQISKRRYAVDGTGVLRGRSSEARRVG